MVAYIRTGQCRNGPSAAEVVEKKHVRAALGQGLGLIVLFLLLVPVVVLAPTLRVVAEMLLSQSQHTFPV
jgi:hypothetical protein